MARITLSKKQLKECSKLWDLDSNKWNEPMKKLLNYNLKNYNKMDAEYAVKTSLKKYYDDGVDFASFYIE